MKNKDQSNNHPIIIGSFKETTDKRVAITPTTVKKLIQMGITVRLEKGFGSHLFKDSAFQDAGAHMVSQESVLESTILVQVAIPIQKLPFMSPYQVLISFTNPFQNMSPLKDLASKQISTLSMEFVPRATAAQHMDALSSQASLAGYVSMMLASRYLKKVIPMMMTPSGTIKPVSVCVIGAGVAGLQAIATAKRMGAQVSAFDTRPAARDQIKSLGAQYIDIDLGGTKETHNGYAKALTPDQIDRQQSGILKACKQADIIITTAQVFGKKAPQILNKSMVSQCKDDVIIVDLAASSGGNVEGIPIGSIHQSEERTLIGLTNYCDYVALDASEMYATNIANVIATIIDSDSNQLDLDDKNTIIKAMLTTKNGQIVSPLLSESKGR